MTKYPVHTAPVAKQNTPMVGAAVTDSQAMKAPAVNGATFLPKAEAQSQALAVKLLEEDELGWEIVLSVDASISDLFFSKPYDR